MAARRPSAPPPRLAGRLLGLALASCLAALAGAGIVALHGGEPQVITARELAPSSAPPERQARLAPRPQPRVAPPPRQVASAEPSRAAAGEPTRRLDQRLIGTALLNGSATGAQHLLAAPHVTVAASTVAQAETPAVELAPPLPEPKPVAPAVARRQAEPDAPRMAEAKPPRAVASASPGRAAKSSARLVARAVSPRAEGAALAYASPDDPLGDARDGASRIPWPGTGRKVAVYDISAQRVYMPSGDVLEAHSGQGSLRDNPKYVHVKMRGPTPPSTYRLSMREKRFFGVEALRLTPVDGVNPFGRVGLLTHSYLRRRPGDSAGCVAFKDYPRFLNAWKRGEVDYLVIVPSMDNPPKNAARFASLFPRIR